MRSPMLAAERAVHARSMAAASSFTLVTDKTTARHSKQAQAKGAKFRAEVSGEPEDVGWVVNDVCGSGPPRTTVGTG